MSHCPRVANERERNKDKRKPHRMRACNWIGYKCPYTDSPECVNRGVKFRMGGHELHSHFKKFWHM